MLLHTRFLQTLLKALYISSAIRRSDLLSTEKTSNYWKSENRPHFSRLSISLLLTSFFKDSTNHKKKTNRTVVFSHRPLPNILKYWDRRWDHPTIWKIRLLETLAEEFHCYVWKFKLTLFQNRHRNSIRTRRLWRIKVGYELRNQLWSYMNIIQF